MAAAENCVVDGFLGPVEYRKEAGSLIVEFSDKTPAFKEELKELRFKCMFHERVWKLRNATEEDEAALRRLLATGSAAPPSPPAAAAPEAAPGGTPAQRGERKRGREEDGAEEEEVEEEAKEEEAEPFLLFDGAVSLAFEGSGHAVLEGQALHNISLQLERILHFRRLPAAPAVAPAAPAAPRWRSGFALNRRERLFLHLLLGCRKDSLLNAGYDDKEPLPRYPLPPRFRPVGADGKAMRGPLTVRNGQPHNIGRQFFTNDVKGFIWADGTRPGTDEDETQRRFNAWMGGFVNCCSP